MSKTRRSAAAEKDGEKQRVPIAYKSGPRSGSDLVSRLRAIVGEPGVIDDPTLMPAFLTEPRGMFPGRALCVARPSSVEQVSQILASCDAARVGVVCQGGNTGLVGGQTPDDSGEQIILSMQWLDRIREIDSACDVITCEAGVPLVRVQEAAAGVDRYFPLSLASEGSCTIGGNLATNAGGVHVIAYGSARDLCLGIEAVLADGRVVNELSKLRKDNAGYDLTSLFIGSEGTLGVITAATLKLFPRPRATVSVFVAMRSVEQALELLSFSRSRFGSALEAFELIPRIGLDFVLRHCGPDIRAPFPLSDDHPWHALIDFAATRAEGFADSVMETLDEAARTLNLGPVAVAASLKDRADFWRLRESLPLAQKYEGGSIKHDVSAPISDLPAFIREANAAIRAIAPGARPVPFGHLGDGNIHYNVSQPLGADTAEFLGRWDEINESVHRVVAKFGGSVAAEHGVGRLKRDLLAKSADPVALSLMRALKQAMDPHGVLNPGKVL